MRLQGWEARLAGVIEAARPEPFAWGSTDCFRLACSAVEALTGENHWPRFAGRYASKRAALRIIAERGTFAEFVRWVFAIPAIPVKLARRGDLVLVAQPGMAALGVSLGNECAVRLESRLGFVPRAAIACAWKVG